MPPPRIGLVLGGGGLTGTAFHAGVVAGLAEFAGWDARAAEVIVGTSAGSTTAALLRAGLPPADFVARMAGVPLSPEGHRVLGGLGPLRQPHRRERPPRRPAAPGLLPSVVRRPWRYRPGIAAAALLPEGNLPVDAGVSWIGDLFGTWPDQLLWVCTVRLDDGVRVVFGRDAMATVREAVTASCAIPGYFAPVLIDGHRHVDGGMWSIHNLDLVAGLGLDLVVVSAPMSTADPLAAERGTVVRLPVRRRLDREADRVRRSGTTVVVIQPDARLREVMGTSTMRLSRRAPVARATQSHIHDLVRGGGLDALVSGGRRG
ncbi:MAG: patatin-like phospholipase family protein [Candidatus Nanopelagicales bacterium]|jgi:NTE family protein|nr:patatin-like phospholipase family protein [Candidatus Nanopelagicales bacterium]